MLSNSYSKLVVAMQVSSEQVSRVLNTLGEIYPTDIENEELLNKLARRKAVRTECHTIWTSLTTTEQIILKAVAHLSPYDASNETEDAISALVQKRLLKVDQEKQKLNIEPPVFRVFGGNKSRCRMTDVGYQYPSGFHQDHITVVNSQFITSIDRATSVEEARSFIKQIRDEMNDASHHVYAFRIGPW